MAVDVAVGVAVDVVAVDVVAVADEGVAVVGVGEVVAAEAAAEAEGGAVVTDPCVKRVEGVSYGPLLRSCPTICSVCVLCACVRVLQLMCHYVVRISTNTRTNMLKKKRMVSCERMEATRR